ncbi:putative acetyltransferase [Actinacidiphila reveromycinica]|uniref:Putative acetyltransferase n=1 Tax=Actinacidiphila reveromycinica TaxID=659352 RepID=A0A7U3VPX0_9ACTN|nr:GNAT family N-acetyltransferase [Streptomyces sp. SN-593]BBA99140.1 putative acetyltransferase [Streptomyces sp. SN-593]
MEYEIRPVLPAEWRRSRDLRLASLRDPVAPLAFARTYAEESVLGDDRWQQRASGVGSQQFVAVGKGVAGADGGAPVEERWVGMAVVVEERPGYFCVNAVYLVPEARGLGVADRLLAVALDWGWQRADRLHLWVHEKNPRAEAFYRRLGFGRTGRTMRSPVDVSYTEYELALDRP